MNAVAVSSLRIEDEADGWTEAARHATSGRVEARRNVVGSRTFFGSFACACALFEV